MVAFGLAAAAMFGSVGHASAKEIVIRIGSGHPPTVVYAGLMKNFFQTELQKAIESKTEHKVKFIEGYSGSIVKVFDTFEGVQNGVLDIGGFCTCFEAHSLLKIIEISLYDYFYTIFIYLYFADTYVYIMIKTDRTETIEKQD